MPEDIEILKEYAFLKKSRGERASACMVVAKFRKEYIAICNIIDIKDYCDEHSIVYYTTMDVLEIAIVNSVLTENECDKFISELKSKGS